MRRRIGVAAAIVLVAAGLAVPAAQAKQHMLVGLQDDAMTLHGNPQFTFSTLKSLRTQIVRINLNWNEVAKRRPAHPQDPADPAYDWTVYDRAIRYAAQYGMQAMLSVLFTPFTFTSSPIAFEICRDPALGGIGEQSGDRNKAQGVAGSRRCRGCAGVVFLAPGANQATDALVSDCLPPDKLANHCSFGSALRGGS